MVWSEVGVSFSQTPWHMYPSSTPIRISFSLNPNGALSDSLPLHGSKKHSGTGMASNKFGSLPALNPRFNSLSDIEIGHAAEVKPLRKGKQTLPKRTRTDTSSDILKISGIKNILPALERRRISTSHSTSSVSLRTKAYSKSVDNLGMSIGYHLLIIEHKPPIFSKKAGLTSPELPAWNGSTRVITNPEDNYTNLLRS